MWKKPEFQPLSLRSHTRIPVGELPAITTSPANGAIQNVSSGMAHLAVRPLSPIFFGGSVSFHAYKTSTPWWFDRLGFSELCRLVICGLGPSGRQRRGQHRP